MKPALLVIDIQNVWLDGSADLKGSVEKRTDVINESIRWFRQAKRPIIVIYHEDKESGAIPGSLPFEFAEAIDIEDTDIKLTKRYPNSFNKTGLENILRKMDCDTAVIVGLSASGCALATYFGALDSDLRPYLVKGGVAASSEEHVRFAEEICDTVVPNAFQNTFL